MLINFLITPLIKASSYHSLCSFKNVCVSYLEQQHSTVSDWGVFLSVRVFLGVISHWMADQGWQCVNGKAAKWRVYTILMSSILS